MATVTGEVNQPAGNPPRRKWVRSFFVVLVLLIVSAAGVQWLRSQRFEAKIVEAGGQLFVDDSNLVAQSVFDRLGDRFVNRWAGKKDRRIHHIRFVGSTIGDKWLMQHRDEIENLSQFTQLTLEDSRVTTAGLAALRGISSVFTVDVSGTPLTADALDHLASMPDLWNLDISKSGLPDRALVKLKLFPSLKWIKIDASQATEEGIRYIAEIPQLAGLCLVNPTVETLLRLPHALQLNLEDAIVTPQMIETFEGMRRLAELTLLSCEFVDCSEHQLRAALPDCQVRVHTAHEVERMKAAGLAF